MSKASMWADQFGATVQQAMETQPVFRDRNGNRIGTVTGNGSLRVSDREEISPVLAVAFGRWVLETFEEDTADA